MRRAVPSMMVAFRTSVTLFAVSLAILWPKRYLPWPVTLVRFVVVASSAFLTVRGIAVVPEQGERGEIPRDWERLVYPIPLFLACLPVALQLLVFRLP